MGGGLIGGPSFRSPNTTTCLLMLHETIGDCAHFLCLTLALGSSASRLRLEVVDQNMNDVAVWCAYFVLWTIPAEYLCRYASTESTFEQIDSILKSSRVMIPTSIPRSSLPSTNIAWRNCSSKSSSLKRTSDGRSSASMIPRMSALTSGLLWPSCVCRFHRSVP